MTQQKTLLPFSFLVLLTSATVTANSDKPIYKKVGDKVILTPGFTDNITDITWKHGPDIAMQWDGDEFQAFRNFKGRGTLNTLSGAMTITELTREHSGIYTAEINGEEVHKTQVQVISAVSKPSVSTWFDPDMNYCLLTCEGNTSDAEPITFKWQTGDRTVTSTNVYNMTKEMEEHQIRCLLENPVSSEESDAVTNPFNNNKWNPLLLLLLLLPLLFIPIVIWVVWHRRKKGGADLSGGRTAFYQRKAPKNIRGEYKAVPNGNVNAEVHNHVEEAPEVVTEDPPRVESNSNSNNTEAPEVVTEDPPRAESDSNSKNTEGQSGTPQTHQQNPTCAVEVHEPPSTSKDTEAPEVVTEDPPRAESDSNSKNTEGHSGTPQTHQQNPTCAVEVHEPPSTSKDTEAPEVVTEDPPRAESDSNSKNTEGHSGTPQTHQQNPTCAVEVHEPPSTSKDTEDSAAMSPDEETRDQEAPEDE